MIPGAECVTCVFWQLQDLIGRSGVRLGQCRAHAPVLVAGIEGKVHSKFPLMAEDDWCGDHAVTEQAA
jgi:hypothetical protein